MLSICAYEATRIGFTAISRSASKAQEFVCQRETTVVPVLVLECVMYTYVIDRATQKLIGRRVKKPDANDEFCGLATNDLTLSFVRGSNVVQALQKEAAPNTVAFLAATAFVLLMLAWAWRVIRKA